MKQGLNIGCGTKRITDDSGVVSWLNVDVRPDVGADQIVDLTQRWPFDDETFDLLMADNVLEHLASHQAIHALNEIGRVLKLGGCATIIVPHAFSQGAFQDPTHRSFWVPRSALYWNQFTTPHGGKAVGITANLKTERIEISGNPETEQFIRFDVSKV